jgi:hypothetical protein
LPEERKELGQKIGTLEAKRSSEKKCEEGVQQFVKLVSKYTQPLEELTREIVFDLIEKNVVYDSEGKRFARNDRKQRVDIHYRFVGMLDT